MSQRGSFCTEYIYDKDLAFRIHQALCGPHECSLIASGHVVCGYQKFYNVHEFVSEHGEKLKEAVNGDTIIHIAVMCEDEGIAEVEVYSYKIEIEI